MNKYHYRFIVGLNFNAEPSQINDIQKYISGVLETSIRKSASIVAGYTLDITDVRVYLSDKTDVTAEEEKKRLKKIADERREKKYINPDKCSEIVQNVFSRCLSGSTDAYFKKLLFVSDKYILFKVPGRTEHLVRTEYAYCPPQYFLINLHNANRSLKESKYALNAHSDLKENNITEFYKEGRLTKEDKQQIYKIIGQEIKL